MEVQFDGFLAFVAALCAVGFGLGWTTRMRSPLRTASLMLIGATMSAPLGLLLVEPGSHIGAFFVLMSYAVAAPPFLLSVALGASLRRRHVRPAV